MDLSIKVVAIIVLICPTSGQGTDPDEALNAGWAEPLNMQCKQAWRDVDHAGFNAIYFLMKVHGKAQTYDQCLRETVAMPLPQTLAEILTTADCLGMPLQPRSLSPQQLDELRLPAIAHLEGDNPAEGWFVVLLQVRDRAVVYLNGSTGTVGKLDKEMFLRRWSGVVATPSTNSIWVDVCMVVFGLVSGLSLARLYYRNRRHV